MHYDIPKEYKHGDTVLWISKDTSFDWAGAGDVGTLMFQPGYEYGFRIHSNTQPIIQDEESRRRVKRSGEAPTGDEIIDNAIYAAKQTIFKKNFVPWKFHPRNWTEPSAENGTYISTVNLEVLQDDPEDIAKPLAGTVDESYALELREGGNVSITANSSVGIVRGLVSFTQLFYEHSEGGAYTPFAPVTIFDVPVFQHRGINLDVSRNYFSVKDIERTIDAAAYNKMNRFHLHVTDAQSWPLEIPALPELSAKGAYRPELVYTKEDFANLQYYASMQGVEFITEIDMPGHTSSIALSHPDLIAAYNVQPDWNTYCAEPPCGTLKLNSTNVDDFLKKLFDDLLPRVLPFSSYFHTGGDEVNKNSYLKDDTVNSNDSAVLQPLMQKFVDRNHDQIRAAGLTPLVWEETLLDWNLTLGSDVIVQSWQSDEAVAQIVAKGHKVLAGNYNYWYLDCGKGQWLNFDTSVSAQYWPYEDYCAPFHNWRLAYSYDPLTSVPTDSQHLVIGGEAHMWAEQTDPINVDRMIWPRGSAVAEILWSGAKDAQGQNRSQIDAAPRLSEMRERLVARGIGAEPIQMPFCTMEGNVCELG
ncbi:Glucosamine-6-phosphate isomerase (Glucosamine-6-phosphate deaminase) (GNPDA) (GlcN6P deaminase) [Didymosphaeria variabile]|uniref:Beta-hexosaminidase n=1 Tax=Didymosphaeria variabile TaxID=1932322 RepID=A0A9W8XE17_9PLEO|nr:Glucosamine-6-phosphate isomerase (Glucosamine-6-phosphate deaminase) (GNPDA) (GlcN6P deaminase) [Didymosphaeria variabile]KAJ4347114.1 Glucosamine-6-phosphate isomerase (Glucosamine-6-phosphate deaminase) (GNPDA) (GlcN6P deaminase) [Didymosphaeria variabile]